MEKNNVLSRVENNQNLYFDCTVLIILSVVFFMIRRINFFDLNLYLGSSEFVQIVFLNPVSLIGVIGGVGGCVYACRDALQLKTGYVNGIIKTSIFVVLAAEIPLMFSTVNILIVGKKMKNIEFWYEVEAFKYLVIYLIVIYSIVYFLVKAFISIKRKNNL